jgi:hypothetical protein
MSENTIIVSVGILLFCIVFFLIIKWEREFIDKERKIKDIKGEDPTGSAKFLDHEKRTIKSTANEGRSYLTREQELGRGHREMFNNHFSVNSDTFIRSGDLFNNRINIKNKSRGHVDFFGNEYIPSHDHNFQQPHNDPDNNNCSGGGSDYSGGSDCSDSGGDSGGGD